MQTMPHSIASNASNAPMPPHHPIASNAPRNGLRCIEGNNAIIHNSFNFSFSEGSEELELQSSADDEVSEEDGKRKGERSDEAGGDDDDDDDDDGGDYDDDDDDMLQLFVCLFVLINK